MTDLEILNEMVNTNNQGIKATTTLTDFNQVKSGGKITFGVDRNTYNELSHSFALNMGEWMAIAYFIKKSEFDKIKNKVSPK